MRNNSGKHHWENSSRAGTVQVTHKLTLRGSRGCFHHIPVPKQYCRAIPVPKQYSRAIPVPKQYSRAFLPPPAWPGHGGEQALGTGGSRRSTDPANPPKALRNLQDAPLHSWKEKRTQESWIPGPGSAPSYRKLSNLPVLLRHREALGSGC